MPLRQHVEREFGIGKVRSDVTLERSQTRRARTAPFRDFLSLVPAAKCNERQIPQMPGVLHGRVAGQMLHFAIQTCPYDTKNRHCGVNGSLLRKTPFKSTLARARRVRGSTR